MCRAEPFCQHTKQGEDSQILTKDPAVPAIRPNQHISTIHRYDPLEQTAPFSRKRSRAKTPPIVIPPTADTNSPSGVTAPFVPGGTFCMERMRIGRVVERIPSSDARVSAKFVASWLFEGEVLV